MRWPSGAREGCARWLFGQCRKLFGGQVAQARVWAFAVICDPPLFNFAPRVIEGDEDVFVEALVAQPRVETLDVRILDRLAPFDKLQMDAMIIGPLIEHLAAEFGAIIRLNHDREATRFVQAPQNLSNAFTRQ